MRPITRTRIKTWIVKAEDKDEDGEGKDKVGGVRIRIQIRTTGKK